ncbi:chromatin modification- protein VID21, partial [Rhizopus stolonifer]
QEPTSILPLTIRKGITINANVQNTDIYNTTLNHLMYNGVKLSADPREKNEEGLDLYAWQLRATHFSLFKQLQTARKTLTTHDWMLARDELKSVKTIQKIESLKKKSLWSLRQLKKHRALPRPKTHWDCMIDEMKWMHTDFKEERKWKMAMAYVLSHSVMEWHVAEDKSTVCVKTRIPEPKSLPTPEPMEMDSTVAVEPNLDEQSDLMMPASTVDQQVGNHDKADTTDESSSMPTTPHLQPANLSSEIIQNYRNIMKDYDPNMPIMTLPVEEFGEFDATVLFPDLLTYEPPNPQFNDLYFNEAEFGRITPISKLTTHQVHLKSPLSYSRKRDSRGNLIETQQEEIKPLPRHERYDNTPIVSLFSPKRQKDAPPQQPVPPQPSHRSSHSGHWSEDDDVCLITFIIQYSFNWELIADAFNAARLSITGEKRTPWECYERWRRNNLTSLSGQVSMAYTSKLKRELKSKPVVVRFDSPQKRQRQYNMFEAIKKTQKKREEAEKNVASSSAPPRQTIEVHGTNSAGQRLPTAMEMSLHKAQRERQMAQAVLEQRQLSAAISLGSQPN